MASIFFVRCKHENRRFSGAKSRFSRAADRNKDAASRAGELIRGSLNCTIIAEMHMSKIIFVSGACGSGKTTFADAYANHDFRFGE